VLVLCLDLLCVHFFFLSIRLHARTADVPHLLYDYLVSFGMTNFYRLVLLYLIKNHSL